MPIALDRLRAALAGRYQIEREAGSGGMAIVYLARDVRHDRRVALKVLRDELTAALGSARFLAEVRITARLQHPHILPLIDSGEVDGTFFYVMPFVEGESLATRLAREGALPVPDAVRILRDVADALAHAHAQGIVHRDIKPDNILLSGRHALVADFGIAKALTDATGQHTATVTGLALGTPRYMSPEQAVADHRVDHRADLYALGVVGYEMLAGSTPFSGATAQAMLAAHTSRTPEPVTAVRPAVPPALGTLVMRCLEKSPADRWQRADDIVNELEALSTPGGGTSPAQPVTRGTSRRRALAAASLVVVAGAAGLTLSARGDDEDPDPREVLVMPFEVRGTDETFRDAGTRAANRIEQAIPDAGGAVRPAPATVSGGSSGGGSGAALRRLARDAGAGTVVTGALYDHGDSVEALAWIHRLHDGELRQRFAPAYTGPTLSAALDSIRQRVVAALAIDLDRDVFAFDASQYQAPPNLEVFRLHRQAMIHFNQGRFQEAIPILEGLYRVDSTYLAGVRLRAWAHHNRGQDAQRVVADSLLRFLEARRARLTRAENAWVSTLRATMSGGTEEQYRAASEGVRIDPQGFAFATMSAALSTFRPREALRHFAAHDTTTMAGQDWVPWWIRAISAHHMLGQDEEALRLAREGRVRNPRFAGLFIWHARLLASLGRFDELDTLMNQSLSVLAANPYPPTIGLELLAHGFPERARDYLNRSLDWLTSRPPAETALNFRRSARGQHLYWLERYADAESVFRSLVADVPDEPQFRGWHGMALGRMGRVDEALEHARQLRAEHREHYRGLPMYHAARVMAAAGERGEAVALLRQALELGATLEEWHTDPTLRLLHGFAPYEELVRPRG